MPVDQSIIDQVNQHLLEGTSQSFLRRQERADEVAGQALEDVRSVATRQRQDFHILANLVMDRIAEDMIGDDDPANERILTSRDIEAQPQENTQDDPNFRGGASAPTAPPSPSASK